MGGAGRRGRVPGRLPRGALLTPEELAARLRRHGCVFAEEEAAQLLAAGRSETELLELVRRREAGEPLEVVLGRVDFLGRVLAVGPGAFVPRRRTELLARRAARALPPGGTALDLCCGVGAVAHVLADVAGAEVHASDLDPVAVCWARRNLAGRAQVHHGDLYAALPGRLRGRLDVVAANAPYVPSAGIGLMPPEARDHEPRLALDGGADGLGVQRRIAAGVAEWLAPHGVLLVETGADQAPGTRDLLTAAGLRTEVVRDEAVGGCVVEGRAGAASFRAEGPG